MIKYRIQRYKTQQINRILRYFSKHSLMYVSPPLVVAMANIKREKNRSVFRYTAKCSADKSWRTVCERAKIAPLSFHSCRHGFATALLQANVDPVTVAKLGGWKTPQHVFQTYGHASDDRTITDRIIGTNLTHEIEVKSRKPHRTGTS
jgi:integrase